MSATDPDPRWRARALATSDGMRLTGSSHSGGGGGDDDEIVSHKQARELKPHARRIAQNAHTSTKHSAQPAQRAGKRTMELNRFGSVCCGFEIPQGKPQFRPDSTALHRASERHWRCDSTRQQAFDRRTLPVPGAVCVRSSSAVSW